MRSKHPAAGHSSTIPHSSHSQYNGHRLHMTLRGHHRKISCLQFSPNALMLSSGCSSGWMNIWSLNVSREYNKIYYSDWYTPLWFLSSVNLNSQHGRFVFSLVTGPDYLHQFPIKHFSTSSRCRYILDYRMRVYYRLVYMEVLSVNFYGLVQNHLKLLLLSATVGAR